MEGVPDPKALGRPVILVGNHQLFALDLGPLVREFLIEKGYSPRGAAGRKERRRSLYGIYMVYTYYVSY